MRTAIHLSTLVPIPGHKASEDAPSIYHPPSTAHRRPICHGFKALRFSEIHLTWERFFVRKARITRKPWNFGEHIVCFLYVSQIGTIILCTVIGLTTKYTKSFGSMPILLALFCSRKSCNLESLQQQPATASLRRNFDTAATR